VSKDFRHCVFDIPKNVQKSICAGAPSRTPLAELRALPQTP